MRIVAVTVLASLMLPVASNGSSTPPLAECELVAAEEVRVSTVTDGGSFDITDGRHVRLASIQAPMLSLGRANIGDWPLANEAKARLSSLVLDRDLTLAFDTRSVDRHGAVLAQVFTAEKEWLQGRLLTEGLARVHTQWDTRKCATAMLLREAEARKAKRGIWALPYYGIRTPLNLAGDVGTFQIVEGKIVAAVARRDRIYLNFGTDYRNDFTVTISPRDARRMAKEEKDPLAWNAKRVRIRGWISLSNGPEIELTHPEQIELLD